jgi:hypothetical protein
VLNVHSQALGKLHTISNHPPVYSPPPTRMSTLSLDKEVPNGTFLKIEVFHMRHFITKVEISLLFTVTHLMRQRPVYLCHQLVVVWGRRGRRDSVGGRGLARGLESGGRHVSRWLVVLGHISQSLDAEVLGRLGPQDSTGNFFMSNWSWTKSNEIYILSSSHVRSVTGSVGC